MLPFQDGLRAIHPSLGHTYFFPSLPATGPYADILPASANGLITHPNGAVTPVDTPSVAILKAAHLAALGIGYANTYFTYADAYGNGRFPAMPAYASPFRSGEPAIAAALSGLYANGLVSE